MIESPQDSPSPMDLGPLDIDSLTEKHDAAVSAIKSYETRFILNTNRILSLDSSENPLQWNSIKYGKNEINDVPDNRRGVYAFVICHQKAFLPSHGYIMYIGIAGRDSNRSLRDRYNWTPR